MSYYHIVFFLNKIILFQMIFVKFLKLGLSSSPGLRAQISPVYGI